jgi:hypothetical protein
MKKTKQELLKLKTLSNVIRDWAGENKKVFWKYEVSCYYETYKMRIANLPNPTNEDIMVTSHNRLLNDNQKKQLCKTIKKVYARAEVASHSCIDVKLEYVKGAVIAEVI